MYTVSIGSLTSGSVDLSASGLPNGVTAGFNPSSLSSSGNSTLTISTAPPTASGTFTVTITGTNGSISHSASVTLVQRWTLFWSDEFDGPAGSPPDPNKWNIDIGGGGWGTGEIECFTNSPNNLAMDGNGNLVITALHQPGFSCPGGTTNDYTSARINTRNFAGVNKFTHTYGWWESRIKLPSTQGTFPAFWHLGDNNVCIGSSWPACGEVDTLENLGREPSISHSGIHGPGYTNGLGCSYTLPPGQVFSADYHVFAMLWEVNSISFFVDGNLCGRVTSTDIPNGTTWIFNAPKGMNIIYDFAIGGPWPGNPDSSSVWPQHMVIDYVRVFDKAF